MFNKDVVNQAIAFVKEAVRIGSYADMAPLEIGSKAIYISRKPDELVAVHRFAVDGTTYYLGFRKEDARAK